MICRILISLLGLSSLALAQPQHPAPTAIHNPGMPAAYSVRAYFWDCDTNPAISLTATDGTLPNQVLVQWTAPSSDCILLGYFVYRSTTSSACAGVPYGSVVAPQTNFIDNFATPGVTYYYSVRVRYKFFMAPCSNVDAGSAAFAPPGQVSGVNASDGSSTSQINLSWNAASGGPVSGYRVAQSTTDQPGAGAVSDVGNVTSHEVTAQPGESYFFSVQAYGPGGNGEWSATDQGSTGFLPPGEVEVSASDDMVGAIEVDWVEGSNGAGGPATHYEIYRGEGAAEACMSLLNPNVPAGDSTYLDVSTEPGIMYFYSMKVVGPGGPSECSNIDSGTEGIPAPGNPSALSASDGTYSDHVQLYWAAPASGGAVTQYEIYRIETGDPCASGTLIETIAAPITSCPDNTVIPGTTYSYVVRAVGPGGASGCSNSDSGWADAGPVILIDEDFETGSGTTWPTGWEATGTPSPDGFWHVAAVGECGAPSKRAAFNRGHLSFCDYFNNGFSTSGNLYSYEFVLLSETVTISGMYTRVMDATDSVSVALRRVSNGADYSLVLNSEFSQTSTPSPFSKTVILPSALVGQLVKLNIGFSANGSGNQGPGFSVDDILFSVSN